MHHLKLYIASYNNMLDICFGGIYGLSWCNSKRLIVLVSRITMSQVTLLILHSFA